MLSWEKYLEKQPVLCQPVYDSPANDLGFIVVIPSFKEPDLISTLNSLKACLKPETVTEVIIVVNSPENADSGVLEINRKTIQDIMDWKASSPFPFFSTHVLVADNLPGKDAGAGLARKIGMDEAVRRFDIAGNKDGIIASLDADCLVEPNYFREVEQFFRNSPKAHGCNIYFEHPVAGTQFTRETYEGIVQYELFLRYFVQALRSIHFPFAFHTIGSAFTVQADAYVRQGGMNKRTAGEDFYFLQKIIPHGQFHELNSTAVYPSPRVSDRVPFGTGAAMTKFFRKGEEILAYDPASFGELGRFLNSITTFYEQTDGNSMELIEDICLNEFLGNQCFEDNLREIRQNSKGMESFRKRFYTWFNAFRVFKFLNLAHCGHYRKLPVTEAAGILLKMSGIQIQEKAVANDLLYKYREIQKKEQWVVRY